MLGWMLALPAMAGARIGPLTFLVRRGATIAILAVRGHTTYHWFTTDRPPRLVLDLRDTTPEMVAHPVSAGLVRAVYVERYGPGGLRLLFNLTRMVPVRFTARAGYGRPGRLEIELGREAPPPVVHPVTAQMRAPAAAWDRATAPEIRTRLRTKPVIIVIDPGHGGSDPGTTGPNGLREKIVTLSIGRMVARRIDATPGMRAVLTRNGDYYVSLRQRVLDAQRHDAALFVSIHANSSPRSPSVVGGAVYMLSEHGASDAESGMLARTENAADPTIDGVHFVRNDPRLNYVLTDLLQNQAIAASDSLGGDILHYLAQVEPLYEPRVQRANFEVLRDPMIPSVLVETAFLSNPTQDRELSERSSRERLADAIYDGIREYVRSHFPGRGTREYTVRNGDTLSGIAARSGVSVDRLRAFNHLPRNDIAAGQVLRIPPGSS
ncbi:MAG: N-acetylmuramoyl-L-alanine amidase [Gammaproteobacteria bacterium]|nr:N-acetylmuramoyl-L-alanine amidase [Gammaproteobacteria bacterium]